LLLNGTNRRGYLNSIPREIHRWQINFGGKAKKDY
jgi:hypothetical protein